MTAPVPARRAERATAWRNWGRSSRSTPARAVRPATAEEVVDVLDAARRDGLPVRPVGSSHSCTPLARTDGVLLRTDRLAGLRAADVGRGRITVGAGTTLAEAGRLAAGLGLGLENLGDIDTQTVAGAIATGTHGTGLAFGPIASRVVGLRLVTAAGEVRDLGEDDPLLPAARVGLGALGVVTDVTLRCVPAFGLAAEDRAEPLDEAIEGFPERAAAVDHLELYWFPGTGTALTRTNTRIPLSAVGPARGRLGRRIEHEVVENGAFELACRLGRTVPALVPALNRLAARTVAARTYRAPSQEVFTAPRRVRFVESEWSVPLAALPDAFRAFRAAVAASGLRISFPVEVRSVAADDSAWLSTSGGRASGYLAVHCYAHDVRREYLRLAERVLSRFDGRPHWGKLHTRDAAWLRPRYPRFDDFTDLRRELDPEGLLANPHLDRVLGPVRAPRG